MNKIEATELLSVIKEALSKTGYSVKIGTASLDGNTMNCKISFTKVEADQDASDPTLIYKSNVKRYGPAFGIDESYIGKQNRLGETFIGLNPSRPKYCVVFRTKSGKIMLTTVDWLSRLDGHKQQMPMLVNAPKIN